MTVGEAMTAEVQTIDIEASAADAAKVMKLFNVGIVPVMEGERVAGVVTDRDLAIRILADPAGARWMPVANAMTERCVQIDEQAGLEEAIEVMEREGVSRLIVSDAQGRPCGILSVADITTQAPPDLMHRLSRSLAVRYRMRHLRSAARQQAQS